MKPKQEASQAWKNIDNALTKAQQTLTNIKQFKSKLEKSKIIKLWTKNAIPTVLQSFKPSGTPGNFPTQQPGGVPILTLL